jgi:hypothetical protein
VDFEIAQGKTVLMPTEAGAPDKATVAREEGENPSKPTTLAKGVGTGPPFDPSDLLTITLNPGTSCLEQESLGQSELPVHGARETVQSDSGTPGGVPEVTGLPGFHLAVARFHQPYLMSAESSLTPSALFLPMKAAASEEAVSKELLGSALPAPASAAEALPAPARAIPSAAVCNCPFTMK